MENKCVAVFGSSSITQDSAEAALAREVGRRLANAGYQVCNGGYMGVMEASGRGASEAGGKVAGVTCAEFSSREPNPFLDEWINTVDLPERISTLMRMADAYVVLGGGVGTLTELLLAWNLSLIGEKKPICIMYEGFRKVIEAIQENTEAKPKHVDLLTFCSDVDQMIETLAGHFEANA